MAAFVSQGFDILPNMPISGGQCPLTISGLAVWWYSLRISFRPIRSLGEMFKLPFVALSRKWIIDNG